jgi:O-antigen ligase
MIVLQAGLFLLMTFAVLAFGAVQIWSQSVLEIGAAVLLVTWAVLFFREKQSTIEWNMLNVPLLGFVAIGVLQLLFRGTAYPYATTQELLQLVTYCVLFFLTAQAFRTRTEKEAVVWVLMALCFGVSLLGIIQHFTAEKQIYWMSSLNVQNDSFGPFVNRNHFAGFVELTVPVALAQLIFRGLRRDAFPLLVLLAIVPVSALILSGSRGGIIGFGLEICLLALLAKVRKTEKQHHLAALAMVSLAAVLLIAWLGAGKAVERFSQARNLELSMSLRVSMGRSALHMFLDHPIKGVGIGALAEAYPRYETVYDGNIVEHVHNDYLEALAESGIAGGICGLIFLLLLYRDARDAFHRSQGHFSRALHAGAIAAVSGLLLHSFIDFNLHIPSNAFLFLVQVSVATSSALPSRSPRADAARYVRRESTEVATTPA